MISGVWSGLGSNVLIFKTYITTYKTYINFSYIYSKFSKHILAYTKHILILRTHILKFFKHIVAFTKHILILRTDNNCFFKQVLIFPYRYYLRYRCYRTFQQELSCIKQSGQSYETYIKNSTRQGEMKIIFDVSANDLWRHSITRDVTWKVGLFFWSS